MLYTFKLAVLSDKPEEAVKLVGELNKITGGDAKLVEVVYESAKSCTLGVINEWIQEAIDSNGFNQSEILIQIKPAMPIFL